MGDDIVARLRLVQRILVTQLQADTMYINEEGAWGWQIEGGNWKNLQGCKATKKQCSHEHHWSYEWSPRSLVSTMLMSHAWAFKNKVTISSLL